MLFAWQAQGFRDVSKCVAGAGVCDVGRRGGFEEAPKASDAESVEGLQISCHGSVSLQRSFRVAVTGLRMPRLHFFVAGAILLQHPLKNR